MTNLFSVIEAHEPLFDGPVFLLPRRRKVLVVMRDLHRRLLLVHRSEFRTFEGLVGCDDTPEGFRGASVLVLQEPGVRILNPFGRVTRREALG